MTDLVITGFMGTGKTTVGRLTAHRLGVPFVDMDAEIERREGRTVRDIFEQEGETAFRDLESKLLQELMRGDCQVIATGGGTLLREANRAAASDAVVVCLTCSSQELEQRLSGKADRPLLGDAADKNIARLLETRRAAYDLFEQVDTTGRKPDDIAEELVSKHEVDLREEVGFSREMTSRVVVGAGVCDRIGTLLDRLAIDGSLVVVTDETVHQLPFARCLESALRSSGREVHQVVIPSGERYKTLETMQGLYRFCAERKLDRDAVIVGIGGGVVCDVAGYLAATYLRGVTLVVVPTTLLAQVDAAIGGKVGVDLDGTKNLVGAFHPAAAVLIDPRTLRTLPDPMLRDGHVEMLKIAMVRSLPLVEDLERVDSIRSIADRPDLIRRAALEKVRVVREDPYERGIRAVLNYGHTVGHGLEAASAYSLSHGHSVAIGMIAESRLATDKGWCGPDVVERAAALLHIWGIPTTHTIGSVDDVVRYMSQDKKRSRGTLRVAVPTRPGTGQVFCLSENDARRAVEYALKDHK